jgi:inner membrane transporter RhtA
LFGKIDGKNDQQRGANSSGMKPGRTKPAVPPIPAAVLAMISVQGGAALAKGLFPVLGPAGTVGLRIGLSALILLAAFRPRLNRLNRTQWRAIVPYGVVLGFMNMLFYFSLSRIPLGLAVTVEFSGPLAVAVFGSRKAVDLLWVMLAAAGIALITPWSGSRGVDPVGVLLAGAAGACWAAYLLLGGKVSRILPGGAAVAAGMMVAAITAVPIAAAVGRFTHLTAGRFAVGVGVALLSSAIPYTLEMIALKAIPARTFGILMSVEPAVAAFAGLIFLHEVLTPPQWLAVALVIAASTGSTLTSLRADRNEASAEEGWQGG